jgi:flagellar biosynthesis protein FlhB
LQAAMADKDEQTEAPTAKRKADAARKGDVLQSRELGTALAMLAGAGWLVLAGPMLVDACRQLLANGLSFDRGALTHFDPLAAFVRLGGAIILPLAMLFAVSMAAAIAGPALLGSLGFRGGSMAFKASRINPLSGLKRIFGAQGLIELAKALSKAVVLGLLGYWLLAGELRLLLSLGFADAAMAASTLGSLVIKLALWLALGLALIALIDVPVQYFQRLTRLRMSKQEVKDEHKESDGSPEVKHAIRQRQMAVLNGSARKAVSEATVVLTNPTHFAVALRYEPGRDFAPLVVARGHDEIALAIRELAEAKAVPMLEYPQLTRAIYYSTRTGQPVAEDLYIAVATILAFVFNLDRAIAERAQQPDVSVPPTKCFDGDGKLRP